MKDNSLLKLGGACAILLGIAKFLASIAYFVVPPEQRLTVPGAQLLPSFAQGSTFLMAIFWLEALVGVLGLAVVPALSSLVRTANEGWVRWTSNLALVGYAVSAVGYLLTVARLPGIAAAYVAGDASTKAALAVVWKSSPDLLGMWGYGVIGVWVLVVNLLAMRANTLPKLSTYVGLVLAALYVLVPVALLLKASTLILIVVGAGAVVAPIWYIWSGLILRRTSAG